MRSGGQPERQASLEAQRRALAETCKRRGWQLLELGEEAGFSAEELERPGIREALRVLEMGDAQALLARKLDSPARSLLDLACLLASAQQQGFALVALDCALETRTPAGEAAVNVLASFAPCELGSDLAASTAGARAQARAGRPARPAANHVSLCARADQARASSRHQPRRDRERAQRGSHPHRAGRPPLVPGHRPLHAQPHTLTRWPCRLLREVRRPDCGMRDPWFRQRSFGRWLMGKASKARRSSSASSDTVPLGLS